MQQPNKDPESLDKTRVQANQGTDSGAPQNVQLPEQFELMGTLGQGGMGTVFKARNKYTERVVAIKVLSGNTLSEEALLRFQREARAIAKLEHENVVSLFDFGVAADGSPYCVMEFSKGRDLGTLLKEKGTLDESIVVDIFEQVCAALSHAHDLGVVHRDLKPGNIMLAQVRSGKNKVKVLDFGIAKLVEVEEDAAGAAPGKPGQPRLTKTGTIVGTPLYMSPEQCDGGKIDGRSDIYAMGAVIYHCLCGKPPHVGTSAIETMLKRMSEEPLTFKEQGVNVSPKMEAIVRKCLQREPSERFESTAELSAALAGIHPPKKKTFNPLSLVNKKVLWSTGLSLAFLLLGAAIVPLIQEQYSLLTLTPEDRYVQTLVKKDPVHVKVAHLPPRGLQTLSLDHSLQTLDLSGCTQVGDKELVSLEQLPLKSLNLGQTKITDAAIKTVSQLKSLDELYLPGTAINTIAVGQILSSLPGLRTLDISRTKVDAKVFSLLAGVTDTTKLEKVALAGLPGLVHGNSFADLKKSPVSVWDFSDDKLDDSDLENMTGLAATKTFILNNNPHITVDGLGKLTEMSKLESLALSQCHLSEQDLSSFRKKGKEAGKLYAITPNDDGKLVDKLDKSPPLLDFHNKILSDQGMKVFTKAPFLRNLSLSKCYEVDDAGVAFLQGLPLQNLNLDWTNITDASMKTLTTMPELEELSLVATNIHELGDLGKLTKLSYLNLSQVKNIASLPSWAEMTALRKLHAAGTDLTSARKIIASLKNSKITDCNLAECGLNDSDMETISQATRLRILSLGENQISRVGLLKLAVLPELERVKIPKCPLITDNDVSEFLKLANGHCVVETK